MYILKKHRKKVVTHYFILVFSLHVIEILYCQVLNWKLLKGNILFASRDGKTEFQSSLINRFILFVV